MKRENEVKGIIYSAKNKITGEYYVGATTSTIEKRRKDHEEKANNGYGGYFQSSIAGYGRDAFVWVQEDTACSLNELAQKEKDYIIKYNSKSKGYNQNLGGGFKKDIYMYNIYGSHLWTFNSLQAAADWAGTTKKEISRTCLSKHKTISGFMWSYEFVERLYPEKDDRCKMVYQFTIDGDLISKYESVSEASSFTGTNKSSIAKVCRGEQSHAGGFLWKYDSSEKKFLYDAMFNMICHNTYKRTNINNENSDESWLTERTSTEEVENENGLLPQYNSSIMSMEQFLEFVLIKYKNSRKLIRTSLDGSSMSIFPSIAEASRMTGITRTSISRACRGLQETAGESIWKYE